LPMNFGGSKVFCIQKPCLHGFGNWRYFQLSCSYQIDVIQWHITTGGWNCDVWLHNELLKLILHVHIRSCDSHGCCAWLARTLSAPHSDHEMPVWDLSFESSQYFQFQACDLWFIYS
jgi:hypothetical protein